LLLPPLEPLALPEPEPEAEPASPAAPPLEPPFWPCALLSAAAPVRLVFFFALCLPEALLSAEAPADASCELPLVAALSFAAVCIELLSCDLPLMLEVLLFDDLLLLDLPELELELVSLGIEVLPPDALVLLSILPGLLVLEPAPAVVPGVPACVLSIEDELFRLLEPLPIDELLLPE
jgi:hypothetical protein